MPWVIRIADDPDDHGRYGDPYEWLISGNDHPLSMINQDCDWSDSIADAYRWADPADAVAFATLFDDGFFDVVVVEVEA